MYPPNYADPSELSRYPASVSMAYYPSSDPTLVAAMSRDHSTTFGAADQSKYSHSTDGTSPATSQQQTQQGESHDLSHDPVRQRLFCSV